MRKLKEKRHALPASHARNMRVVLYGKIIRLTLPELFLCR